MSGWFRRLLSGQDDQEHQDQQRQPDAAPPAADSWYVPSADEDRWNDAVGGLPPMRLIDYNASDGERVLRLCEDATGLLIGPTDRRLARLGIYSVSLRGESYHAAACRAGDFSPGAMLALCREPNNQHDTNAVGVTSARSKAVAAT